MVIEITPLDTLFFRDGKPFLMGEDTWADGMFPPLPSVIYGALRTLYFVSHMDEFERFRNSNDMNDDSTKNLKIKGIYLKDTETNSLLFPVSLDIVRKKGDKNNEVYSLILEKNDNYSSLSTTAILKHEDENSNFEKIEDGIMEEKYFIRYLSKENGSNFSKKLYYESIKKYFDLEPKTGIRKDDISHSSEEGAFYRVGMYRPQNLSIMVDFDGLEGGIPDKGLMKLGGEGKAVTYKKVDKFSLFSGYKPVIKDGRFKLYLATPAIFDNGWRPGWLDKEDGLNGIKPRLLAAAVGKYINIGGFDMKNGKPKKMYRAVPAGSVYYFEAPEGVDEQKIIETFHSRTISEISEKEGFGLAFLGVI